MSLEAHLEIFYLHFLLEKKIYRSGVPLSSHFQGLYGKVREGPGQPPKAIRSPLRASAHLALELGFPEISPRALGDRSRARSGVGLARGQRLGGAWTFGPQELDWPHRQSGENMGHRPSP